ncbi:MAG: hypothetical protein ACRD4L_01385 [Pyrinomonadaceae bacterium]
MVGVSGIEKFSHLEDKIYRTIELTKSLRQEKEALNIELASVGHDLKTAREDNGRLAAQIERLLAERDAVRMKVEAMLDAISVLEQEQKVETMHA